jgi:transcriptional regulator with XRE-family HTH domain
VNELLADKLTELMKQKGVNKADVANGSGIPYTTIDGLFKKNCDNTKLSTLLKLSDYFGITLDELAEKEKPLTNSNGEELNQNDIKLIEAYHKLTPEQRQLALNLFEQLLKPNQ